MSVVPMDDLLDPLLLGNLAENGPVVLLAPPTAQRIDGIVVNDGNWTSVPIGPNGHIAEATNPRGDHPTSIETTGDRSNNFSLILFLPRHVFLRGPGPDVPDMGYIVQWRGKSCRVTSYTNGGEGELQITSLTAEAMDESNIPAGLPAPPPAPS